MDALLEWKRSVTRLRSTTVTPTTGGEVMRHAAFPSAHDHNLLVVWEPCTAAALLAAADEGLADVTHRLIEVLPLDLAEELAPGLTDAGYSRDDNLLMTFQGTARRSARVEELSLEERITVAAAEWERDQPSWAPQVWQQLGARARTIASHAVFLGIRVEGEVVSHVDLFVVDGVAQVEELMTAPAFQGQGMASDLVLDAAARGLEQGVSTVLLVADLHDWPAQLYRRLGFVDHLQVSSFYR